MLFSHDTEHSLACIVDLVNSAPGRGAASDTGNDSGNDSGSDTGGSSEGDADQLGSVEALSAFVERHEVSEVGTLTRDDLDSVHRLRTLLAEVFDCEDDATAAALVNRLVSQAGVTPRLTDHDGYAWHVHYFSPGASLAEHLTADCGMTLAQVVAAGELERLRRCAAPDCEQVLVDLSRNRSKRYCDARTCGNRLHVAAYRERRRTAAS